MKSRKLGPHSGTQVWPFEVEERPAAIARPRIGHGGRERSPAVELAARPDRIDFGRAHLYPLQLELVA